MKQSYLLTQLLSAAAAIQQERGLPHRSVLCFLMAVADVCATPYAVFNDGDRHVHPERFEEERLRYLFKTLFMRGPQITKIYYRALSKQALPLYDAPFTLDGCEEVAMARGTDAVAADVALLCALRGMPSEHRAALFLPYRSDFSVTDVLAEVDRNVYDDMIAAIDEVCARMQAKAAEAKALRDFRPAAKFAEPTALIDALLCGVSHTVDGAVLQWCLPRFFGTDDGALRLSVFYRDGIYYIHDNGSAVAQLKRHTDEITASRALAQVCHDRWIRDGRIVGMFSQLWMFPIYLQNLIFIAHADLLCDRVSRPLYAYDSVGAFIDEAAAQPFDTAAFLRQIKETVSAGYDEKEGLYITVATRYPFHSASVAYRIETRSDGTVRITDCRAAHAEGAVFESFYANHDDLAPYTPFIERFCERFGAAFDGKELSLTDTSAAFGAAIWRFINLSVLLSELGQSIELPPLPSPHLP